MVIMIFLFCSDNLKIFLLLHFFLYFPPEIKAQGSDGVRPPCKGRGAGPREGQGYTENKSVHPSIYLTSSLKSKFRETQGHDSGGDKYINPNPNPFFVCSEVCVNVYFFLPSIIVVFQVIDSDSVMEMSS